MGAIGLRTYVWNNNIRSTLLLIGFPLLLIAMVFVLTLGMIWSGWLPAASNGSGDLALAANDLAVAAPAAILVAGMWFAVAYLFNQTIIDLATGARPVDRTQEPLFHNLLETLCISRGLRMPATRVIETDGLNAFASGLHEGRFSITVTRGLLDGLDRDELQAVLAHELTHVINRDVRTMVIAAIFAGIITLLCQILFRSLWFTGGGRRGRRGGGMIFVGVAMLVGAVGYLLAILIRMAISRTREYVADAGSVELTKNPDAMISALQKVAGRAHLDAPQSMRAMFLEEDDAGVLGLFATHPPVAKRIAALQRYGGGRAVEPSLGLENALSPAAVVGVRYTGPWGESPTPSGRLPPSRSGPWG